jgi:DNA gyrase/topoisomerase IV subunit B
MTKKNTSQENRGRQQAREVTSRFAAIAFFAFVAMLCLYVILVSPWDDIVSWLFFKFSCAVGIYSALTEIWSLRYSEQEHAEIHRKRLAEERHQLMNQELQNQRNEEEANRIEQHQINNLKNQRSDADSQLNISHNFNEIVEEIKGKTIVTVKNLAEFFAHEQDAVYAYQSLLRLELISANGSPNLARIDFWMSADRVLFRNALESGLFDEPASACIEERIRAENPRTRTSVTRFKGLGEMNPLQLRETTMARETRRLVQLTVDAADNADQLMDMLLAKKRASDRRDWLETKGNLASVVAIADPADAIAAEAADETAAE